MRTRVRARLQDAEEQDGCAGGAEGGATPLRQYTIACTDSAARGLAVEMKVRVLCQRERERDGVGEEKIPCRSLGLRPKSKPLNFES